MGDRRLICLSIYIRLSRHCVSHCVWFVASDSLVLKWWLFQSAPRDVAHPVLSHGVVLYLFISSILSGSVSIADFDACFSRLGVPMVSSSDVSRLVKSLDTACESSIQSEYWTKRDYYHLPSRTSTKWLIAHACPVASNAVIWYACYCRCPLIKLWPLLVCDWGCNAREWRMMLPLRLRVLKLAYAWLWMKRPLGSRVGKKPRNAMQSQEGLPVFLNELLVILRRLYVYE